MASFRPLLAMPHNLGLEQPPTSPISSTNPLPASPHQLGLAEPLQEQRSELATSELKAVDPWANVVTPAPSSSPIALQANAPAPASTASSTPSGTSLALCAIGILSLIISLGVAGFLIHRKRRARSERRRKVRFAVGDPVLQFAPEYATSAVDISKLNGSADKQREMSQHYQQLPTRAYRNSVAPTNWDLPSSSSTDTNSSGPNPGTSSESGHEAGHESDRRTAFEDDSPGRPKAAALNRVGEQEDSSLGGVRRMNRVAVPSVLLRSLGDLPPLPAPGQGSGDDLAGRNFAPGTSSNERLGTVARTNTDEEHQSLTPVLDLGLDISSDSDRGHLDFEAELDFEIEKSMWLTSALETALDSKHSTETKKRLEPSLIHTPVEAPRTSTPPNKLMIATPKSMAGPAQHHSQIELSSSSLAASVENRGRSNTISTGRSISGTVSEDAYATANSGPNTPAVPPPHAHAVVAMPESPSKEKGNKHKSSAASSEAGGFRPLSLGLSLSSSSSSSLGAALFKNARRSLWGMPPLPDLEADSSGIDSSASEGFTNLDDGPSPPTSSTSLDLDGDASISKASIVPAAAVPPLPAIPYHFGPRKSGDTDLSADSAPVERKAPASKRSDVSAGARNRASTFGTEQVRGRFSLEDKFTDSPPFAANATKVEQATRPPTTFTPPTVLAVAPEVTSTGPSSKQPTHGLETPTMPAVKSPFMSPFHHKVFPEVPEGESDPNGTLLSPNVPSPLLAQLGGSPNLKQKPSFTDNLRARLGRNRSASPSPAVSTADINGTDSKAGRTSSFESRSPRPSYTRTTDRTDAASVCSTSYGAPATEQWAVSTEDTDDDDVGDKFLPTVTVVGPLADQSRRGSRQSVGLGMSIANGTYSKASAPSLTESAFSTNRAVGSASMGHPIRPANSVRSSRQSRRSDAPREESRTSVSLSPIMQDKKWALEDGPAFAPTSFSPLGSPPVQESALTSPPVPSKDRAVFPNPSTGKLSGEHSRSTPLNSPRLPDFEALSPRSAHNRVRSPSPRLESTTSPWRLSSARQSCASPDGGADTISIASSCMTGGTDTMGDSLEQAVDRRNRLYESVRRNEQSAARAQAAEEASARAMASAHGFGLGLYDGTVKVASDKVVKRPPHLALGTESSRLGTIVAPLTPPLTPVGLVPSSSSVATVVPEPSKGLNAAAEDAVLDGPDFDASPAPGSSKEPSRIPAPRVTPLSKRKSSGPDGFPDLDAGSLPTPDELHAKLTASARTSPDSQQSGGSAAAPATPFSGLARHNGPKLRPLSLTASSSVLGDHFTPGQKRFSPGSNGGTSPSFGVRQRGEERRQSRSAAGGILPAVANNDDMFSTFAVRAGRTGTGSTIAAGSTKSGSPSSWRDPTGADSAMHTGTHGLSSRIGMTPSPTPSSTIGARSPVSVVSTNTYKGGIGRLQHDSDEEDVSSVYLASNGGGMTPSLASALGLSPTKETVRESLTSAYEKEGPWGLELDLQRSVA